MKTLMTAVVLTIALPAAAHAEAAGANKSCCCDKTAADGQKGSSATKGAAMGGDMKMAPAQPDQQPNKQ